MLFRQDKTEMKRFLPKKKVVTVTYPCPWLTF